MDPVFHFIEFLRKSIPGIKLVEKKRSRLMKFIGFLCFFNKDFMTKTTTVIGRRIYLPTHVPHDLGLMQVLAHEYVHLMDMKRTGHLKFLFLYLFPQSLALFSIFALFTLWDTGAIMFLVTLIFLYPGGSVWRVSYEQKAYAMTLLFELWVRGYTSPATINNVVDILHGPSYYWPGGDKKHSKFYFEIVLEDARRGILPVGEEFRDVYNYLQEEKYLVKSSMQT